MSQPDSEVKEFKAVIDMHILRNLVEHHGNQALTHYKDMMIQEFSERLDEMMRPLQQAQGSVNT